MLHHWTYYPIPTQPVLLLLLAEKKEISILFSLVLLHGAQIHDLLHPKKST
jgi:hypothetical protein